MEYQEWLTDHWSMLVKVARHALRERGPTGAADAEDAAQEVALRLWRAWPRLGSLRQSDDLDRLATAAARRAAIDVARKRWPEWQRQLSANASEAKGTPSILDVHAARRSGRR